MLSIYSELMDQFSRNTEKMEDINANMIEGRHIDPELQIKKIVNIWIKICNGQPMGIFSR